MKSKMVLYMDMFNPTETIIAKNRLQSWVQRDRATIRDYVSLNTREQAQHKKCRCRHPNFVYGVCRYRTCNHDEAHHN